MVRFVSSIASIATTLMLASPPALATIASPIPEPESLALLGIGMVALAIAHLRGRRKK